MWTKASADAFLEQVGPMFASMGLTLEMVGSVAVKGSSDKDLDVVVRPMSAEPQPIEVVLGAVFSTFVPAYTVDTNATLNPLPSHEPPEQTFVNFGLKDGRTLELFFPEAHFPLDAG